MTNSMLHRNLANLLLVVLCHSLWGLSAAWSQDREDSPPLDGGLVELEWLIGDWKPVANSPKGSPTISICSADNGTSIEINYALSTDLESKGPYGAWRITERIEWDKKNRQLAGTYDCGATAGADLGFLFSESGKGTFRFEHTPANPNKWSVEGDFTNQLKQKSDFGFQISREGQTMERTFFLKFTRNQEAIAYERVKPKD